MIPSLPVVGRTLCFFLFLCLLRFFLLPVQAALPELSSIEPIEYDEAAQRIVARGEARFDLNDFRLQADRITYYQTFGLADAEGNVQLTRGSYRLLGDRLSYDTTENIFSVDAFRSGS